MKLLKNSVVIIAMITTTIVNAQPNWSVTPTDYQFTMTVTGVVKFYCQESANETDQVGAFVNGECRGVQSFDTDINGRKFAYITVYSNSSSGEEISFKLYKADEDIELIAVYPMTFENDASYGNAEVPYEFKSDYELKELFLENSLVYDYDSAGIAISSIRAVNDNNDTLNLETEFVDSDNTLDNDYFTLKIDSLMLATNADFANKQSYNIHLRAFTQTQCSIDKLFNLEMINTNDPPTCLVKTDTVIDENEDPGSLILQLIAIDETKNDKHTFELVGESYDWPDHEYVTIEGNRLLSTIAYDYESKKSLEVQILITDIVGNTYTDTLNIAILDVVEFEKLPVTNLITPNDDGYNDYFEIKNVELYSNYQLYIYNDNGNVVYSVDSDYDNTWNGLNRGDKELPAGSYYYIFSDRDNEDDRFVGTINISRE